MLSPAVLQLAKNLGANLSERDAHAFYKTKEANQYGWLGNRMIAMQRLMRMDIIHV